MANTSLKSELDLQITVKLEMTLAEARALNEITKYGSKPFLEWFYRNLGKHYMKPHEKGLISLFDTIDKDLQQKLYDADKIIKVVNETVSPKYLTDKSTIK